MRRKKRPLKFLFLSILSFSALAFLIYSIPPSQHLSIFNLKSSILNLFFLLTFLSIFFATAYLSKSTKHGILLGLFTVSLLSFRLNGLTHPFFLLLLAALFLVLELLFAYKK